MRDDFHARVRRRYKRMRAEVVPRVRAALAKQPLMQEGIAVAINTSQNVLREAMEAVIIQALPQPREYFVELATRLACYAITAMHPDDQEIAATLVRDSLLNKLADMQATGAIIKTEWD